VCRSSHYLPGLFTGTHPNLLPLTLKELLTDLARLQQSGGLMTMTLTHAAARRLANPMGEGVVETPSRHKGGLILRVLTERQPDVLNVQKFYYQDNFLSLIRYSNSFSLNHTFTQTMPPDAAQNKTTTPARKHVLHPRREQESREASESTTCCTLGGTKSERR
jgi:hypothetical protein